MTEEIIIAGFGGQGVSLWAKFLHIPALCKIKK
jgi:Pyruvate/2-oxoacid:ferredoxin oxidoreductase gamma subunit